MECSCSKVYIGIFNDEYRSEEWRLEARMGEWLCIH